MIHRGEILQKAVKSTGTNLTELAQHLKTTRPSLYRWFNDPDLKLDVLISAGKFMNYDFGEFIPELSNNLIKEKEQENLTFQIKYMELAEKYIKVAEEREKYRLELEELKKKNSAISAKIAPAA